MKEIVNSFYDYTQNLSARRNAFMLLPFLLVIISLISAFPSYDNLFTTTLFESGWEAILKQTLNPFANHEYDSQTHEANLTFRITPVVIGKALGISSVTGYLVLQLVALLLLFFVTTQLFKKMLGEGAVSLLFSTSVSLVFIGNVLCSDYRGFFDTLAFLFMGLTLLSERPLLIFASAMLSFYTDERALIASSLVYVFFLVERDYQPDSQVGIWNFFRPNKKVTALLLSWVAYFATRFLLGYFFGLHTNSQGMIDYLLTEGVHHINAIPFGIWTGLEGFWIVVLASLVILILKRSWAVLFVYCGALAIVILIALWTFDITRSMAYLMPSIFIALYIVIRSERTSIKYVSLATFLLCSFPTYYFGGPHTITWLYPLPLQVIRMLLD